MQHLSFRKELHAIEAVIAGQGIGTSSAMCSWHPSLRPRAMGKGRKICFSSRHLN
jgi:hypothetical protein